MENNVGWMCLVLQCFLVHCLSLLVHPALLKLLSPGHIQGSSPGADALTEEVTVKCSGV